MSKNNQLNRLLDMFLFAIVNIWDVIESVVFIGGIFICIMLPVIWPMKFLYMMIWLVIAYVVSKFISVLDEYRRKEN